jgi:hypothetical protein
MGLFERITLGIMVSWVLVVSLGVIGASRQAALDQAPDPVSA